MYIYGILNSNASLHLSIPSPALGVGTQGRGKSNGVAYTIPYQDISALVKDTEVVDTRVERVDYTHMPKDILARLLVDHQKVIERIMIAQDTIIPMRLGVHVSDETEVKEILNKGYNLIKNIFEKIRDKIEIDIAVTWSNFNAMVKEAGEEREIKEFKEGLMMNSKGITVDGQMKIGFRLKKALDKRRLEFAGRIQERLRDLSEDTKTHELMDDNMVLNSAFLIGKAKQEDFGIRIEELNIDFAEKLNFRCVGPLPPYSFYTLEIKIVKNEEVDWAKKKLGILSDITSKDELRRAYLRQAFSTHPDKNPDNPCAEKEFDEVNKAYKILADHCLALEQANQQDKATFDREMFKENVMLVRVRPCP